MDVAEVSTSPQITTIIFTLKEEPGALAETLRVFKQKKVNLTHIESRPSKMRKGCYEILVECAADSDKTRIENIIRLFKQKAENVHVQDFKDDSGSVPWFPKVCVNLEQSLL